MAAYEDESTAVSLSPTFIAPPHPASGPTLLPGPVASLVSLVSKSTAVSIRVGSLIGGTVLDGARIGTLTGLELGRAAVEGILNRAGRDVQVRRGAAEREEYVEGWTDKGVSSSSIVFFRACPNLCIDKFAALFNITHTASTLDRLRDFFNYT